jgi:hypothetical protein
MGISSIASVLQSADRPLKTDPHLHTGRGFWDDPPSIAVTLIDQADDLGFEVPAVTNYNSIAIDPYLCRLWP